MATKRYRVTLDVEVSDEDSGSFQPGSRDASFVDTTAHAVGGSDIEAIRLLFRFALQGNYSFEQFGSTPDRPAFMPRCLIERVDDGMRWQD